jgi:hypothetical protein
VYSPTVGHHSTFVFCIPTVNINWLVFYSDKSSGNNVYFLLVRCLHDRMRLVVGSRVYVS